MNTIQADFWSGNFGKDYTERNPHTIAEQDQLYLKNYGITKTEMNSRFMDSLNRDVKILEVGCNVGVQLQIFQAMGFKHLYGIELQRYAVERAKEFSKDIDIIQGSGFDIPFKDEYFDFVCTNGVLIHIAPEHLPLIMNEMIRCTKRYIFGFEYFAETVTAIPYRGNTGFLWKADYAGLFQQQATLTLTKQEIFPYISDAEKGNRDTMYLLDKSK